MQNAPRPKRMNNVAHVYEIQCRILQRLSFRSLHQQQEKEQATHTFYILIYDVAGCFLALWSFAVPILLVAATECEWVIDIYDTMSCPIFQP